LKQVSSNRNIPNWSIKPHIKHLFLELFDRNRHSPFQITGNTLRLKSHSCPGFRYSYWILRPNSLLWGYINPLFQLILNLRKINKKMNGWLYYGCLFTEMANIIFKFSWRVKQLLTFITLISSCILKSTKRTRSTNKSVSQE
jgi:hypothetical protein